MTHKTKISFVICIQTKQIHISAIELLETQNIFEKRDEVRTPKNNSLAAVC